MKPLELNIYPLDPSFPRGYKLPRDTRITFAAANRMATEKRLTEPELAAEFESARCDALLMREAGRYYSPLGDTWPNDQKSADERAMTLLRLASLPHASERNYE